MSIGSLRFMIVLNERQLKIATLSMLTLVLIQSIFSIYAYPGIKQTYNYFQGSYTSMNGMISFRELIFGADVYLDGLGCLMLLAVNVLLPICIGKVVRT